MAAPCRAALTITSVIIDATGHLVVAPTNSFTPTIGDGTHNFTTVNHTGYYMQVGNVVYFEIWLQWTGKGSAISGDSDANQPAVGGHLQPGGIPGGIRQRC